MKWLDRLRLWIAGDLVQQEARRIAEAEWRERVSKNHTFIGEEHRQTTCYHANGSVDVILSSGDQSVTIALPKGQDHIVLGDSRGYDAYLSQCYSMLRNQAACDPYSQTGRWQRHPFSGVF